MKKMRSKDAFKVAIVALLLLALLPCKSWAQIQPDPLCGGGISGSGICTGSGFTPACSNGETPTCPNPNDIPICTGTATQPVCPGSILANCQNSHGLMDPAGVIFSGHSIAAQSILTISLLLMLVMSFAIAIMYGIGYAFRIDKLLRFAKSEIGEILLTLLIVLLFVGTFNLTSSNITAKNFFAAGNGALNNNIFVSDCTMLVQQSFNLIPVMFTFGLMTTSLNAIGSLSVSFAPNYMGFRFSPLIGISAITSVTNTLMYGTSGFTLILMGAATFLVIIYALFPLFLYLGIILRTLPWTRPAGGAFLGMFIAFYILFPLLIYFMLAGYEPYVGTPGLTMPSSPIIQGISNLITATCVSSQHTCQVLLRPCTSSACPGIFDGSTGMVAHGAGTATYDTSHLSSPNCYSVAAYDSNSAKISLTQTLQVAGSSAPPSTSCPNQNGYSPATGVLTQVSGSISADSFSNVFGTLIDSLIPFSTTQSTGLLNGFIINYIEPIVYTLFSVALSMIISFDFMEAMGDVLGAPSLRSQNMLKRVL